MKRAFTVTALFFSWLPWPGLPASVAIGRAFDFDGNSVPVVLHLASRTPA